MTDAVGLSDLFDSLPATVIGAGSLTAVHPARRSSAAADLAGRSWWTHLDVMDVPFAGRAGIPVTDLPGLIGRSHRSDVHLMVEHPTELIPTVLAMRPNRLTVHLEAIDSPAQVSAHIRAERVSPWLAVSPHTPAHLVIPALGFFDGVLVLLLPPGSAGSAQISRAEMVSQLSGQASVGVDGGVDADNLPRWIRAGARYVVAGRALLPPAR